MSTGQPNCVSNHLRRLRYSHGQGPVIANVTPGVWMLANSHLPSGLNTAPAHSLCFKLLVKLSPEGRVKVPSAPSLKSGPRAETGR